MNLHQALEPECIYHIYNRGINGQNIFFEERNYAYFLSQYAKYLCPVVDTFAYCLLKNHFHLLVQVKEQTEIKRFFHSQRTKNTPLPKEGLHSADFVVSKQFAKFFSSYTQSVNKTYKRTGSLIETPFKRVEVEADSYFTQLIWYIHHNPQKHGFVSNYREYPHSSYHSHLHSKATKLERDKELQWFSSAHDYQHFHETQQDESLIQKYIIEFWAWALSFVKV